MMNPMKKISNKVNLQMSFLEKKKSNFTTKVRKNLRKTAMKLRMMMQNRLINSLISSKSMPIMPLSKGKTCPTLVLSCKKWR